MNDWNFPRAVELDHALFFGADDFKMFISEVASEDGFDCESFNNLEGDYLNLSSLFHNFIDISIVLIVLLSASLMRAFTFKGRIFFDD